VSSQSSASNRMVIELDTHIEAVDERNACGKTRFLRAPHTRQLQRQGTRWVDMDMIIAPVPQLRLVPGAMLPNTRYRIVGWIGEGAMGVVYEAEHVDIERRVAIKILRSDVASKEAGRALRDEARATTRIGSPYILDVYDFGELADARVWVAMQLLHGKSLADELEHGAMEVGRTIGILRQVCKGLGAAHAIGIVHRDVKPDNIVLVESDGRSEHVKLVDFGIATMMADAAEDGCGVTGTPHYMAPEQVSGRAFDGRLDTYAFGCMAYEMLVGQPPFQADTVVEVLKKQLDESPALPSSVREDLDIPSELDDVVMRCLAKNPDDRFSDMAEVEAALCEAQIAAHLTTPWDDLPLPDVDAARRTKIASRMPQLLLDGRIRTRRRWVIPVVGTLALGLSLLMGIAWRQAADARDDSPVEDLVSQARAAAAKAFYVYPPFEDPSHGTAYSKLRELERLEHARPNDVDAAAQRLRREFGDTLIRLGDEYWDKQGGQPFAIDYYAQALLFLPDDEHARERALVTQGQLTKLGKQAETLGFSHSDLVATQPLVTLAQPDPVQRERGLREVVEAARGRSSVVAHSGRPSSPSNTQAMTQNEASVSQVEANVKPKRAIVRPDAVELARAGLSAFRQGRHVEAERLWHQALEADPNNASTLGGLSDLHFHRGAYPQALAFARRAVESSPDEPNHRIRLGDAYFKLFRYGAAREQYEIAKRLRHPESDERLAKVLKKLGS